MTKRNVALVGFSESSRHLAPYDDPDWEIWGCNHVFAQEGVKRIDVGFEIHDLEELEIKYAAIEEVGWPGYLEQLAELPTVWMKEEHADVPGSKRFPIEHLRLEFPYFEEFAEPLSPNGPRPNRARTTFKSTLSYMVAMAILAKPQRLAVYGVDMIVDFEWGFQRHNMQFLLGWAAGTGIDVLIPAECALMKEEDGIELYAYEHNIAPYAKVIAALKASLHKIDERYNVLRRENEHHAVRMDQIDGALIELRAFRKLNHLDGDVVADAIGTLEVELVETKKRNESVLMEMQKMDGGREREFYWLEKLGFNMRGDQLV